MLFSPSMMNFSSIEEREIDGERKQRTARAALFRCILSPSDDEGEEEEEEEEGIAAGWSLTIPGMRIVEDEGSSWNMESIVVVVVVVGVGSVVF